MFEKLCRIIPPEGDMLIMRKHKILVAIIIDNYGTVGIYDQQEYFDQCGLESVDLADMSIIATYGKFQIIWLDA